MKLPIVIAYCGQMRGWDLFLSALRPAITLRDKGTVERIIYSSWIDELDKHPDARTYLQHHNIQIIESIFSERLHVTSSVFEQMYTLDRVLDIVDDDALVIRTRPDVIFDDEQLLISIANQDWSIGSTLDHERGAPIFNQRLWVPFICPAYPFFFSDIIFAGMARDLRRLNNYDMMNEAYRITSRPSEIEPDRYSGAAAAEIRRYMAPFSSRYDLLREYAFVWPQHSLRSPVTYKVREYNLSSDLYREYLALSLAAAFRYLRVGLPPGEGDIRLVRSTDHPNSISLLSYRDDHYPLRERLYGPAQEGLWRVSSTIDWLSELFLAAERDPEADFFLFEPLNRGAMYAWNASRRKNLKSYLDGLYSIAHPNMPNAFSHF